MAEHDEQMRGESSSDRTTSPHIEAPPEADDLEILLEGGDPNALDAFLLLLHPADLALLIESVDRDHWPKVLERLSIAVISDLMEELPDHLRDDLAELLDRNQLEQALDEMASDDVADVLADLPEPLAQQLIQAMEEDDREEVEALLEYPEDSAGGLMQTELVAVHASASVDEVVQVARAHADEVGDFHFVYVTDDDEHLVGQLELVRLILAPPDKQIRDLIADRVHVVTVDVDQEEVAQMFKRYDLVALPVVDDDGRLLGRILHDDVVDVFEEEADEDILQMAGAGGSEPELVYSDQLFKIAYVRLPWLLATLVGLTVPAFLVWAFQLSFPHMLALVPFVPVIGAMGGNVGTQSSTIIVRGFATGRVDFHNLGRFLGRELFISSVMGLACGAVAGVVAFVWHQDVFLFATVSIAMVVAIIISAIMGILVPYLFRLIQVDPAIAAGPAVTTIDDILAIAVYYLAALAIIPPA